MSALSCKGQQEGRGGRRLAAGSVWFSNTGNHQPCPVLVECAERSRPEGVLVGVAGQRAFWTLLVFLGLARPLFRAPGASKFRPGPQRHASLRGVRPRTYHHLLEGDVEARGGWGSTHCHIAETGNRTTLSAGSLEIPEVGSRAGPHLGSSE